MLRLLRLLIFNITQSRRLRSALVKGYVLNQVLITHVATFYKEKLRL